MTVNKITSATLHTTGEGQRISFTYSVIDADTARPVSENNRDSMVVLDISANKNLIDSIADINKAVLEFLEGKV